MSLSNKNARIIIAHALCVFALSVHSGCSSSEGKSAKSNEAVTIPATALCTVQKGKLTSALETPGELIAYQQVDMYAKVNSFVKKLYVDVGSEVSKGQLLAVLEAPEVSSQLEGAHSRLQSQEAVYLASKANYDRLLETSKTPGTISQNDLDQAIAKRNSDYAQLQAAKSAYKEIADTKGYLELRAPFAGVISARNVNAGAYVGPSGKGSDNPIFVLQEQKRLRLVVSVPEISTGYLNKEGKVTFSVRSMPNETFTARVSRLSGALDNRLRAERVEMDVQNPDKKLLPGMVAEVNIPLPARDSAFIVPKTAVVNGIEKVFVIRVINGTAEWVTVKTGRSVDGKTEVYGMLNENDRLVKTASEEIKNGSKLAKTQLAD